MFISADDAGAERARFHHRIRSELEEAARPATACRRLKLSDR